MSFMNRMANSSNAYQGQYLKVLCVCSAGLLRSPTAAVVLSQSPFDFNTRACGAVPEYALIPIDDVLIHWADEIVFMEQTHLDATRQHFDLSGKKVRVLNIPDRYPYRNSELEALIAAAYNEATQLELTGDDNDGIHDSN